YHSIYMSNIREQTMVIHTCDAEFLVNNSLYPLDYNSYGLAFESYPENRYYSLPYWFNRRGYVTVDIHPESASLFNWYQAERRNGYQRCLISKDLDMGGSFENGNDAYFLPRAAKLIAECRPPFMVFLITRTAHVPFELPREHWQLDLRQYGDHPMVRYLQAQRFADGALGDFLTRLDREGLLENTVAIFYGDHEGVHKYYPDQMSDIDLPGDWWQDNKFRTPVIIYEKGQEPEVIDVTGGEIDLLPTILYLWGVDEKEWYNKVIGRNLLNTSRSFALLPDGKIADGETSREPEPGDEWIIEGYRWSGKIVRSDYFGQKIAAEN
ncbi:MAG: sulfatase-like hydrolase/transferase, partial [Negativicutes bacterium]|nr:sulfatase-like hydrolase/transferase [Negativicutes bacterium]